MRQQTNIIRQLNGREALTNYQPTNPETPVAISNINPLLIGQFLRRNSTAAIDSINLSNHPDSGVDQIAELVEILIENRPAVAGIRKLTLSKMNLSAAPERTKDSLRAFLSSLSNLESLDLSGNNMAKGDIDTLLGSLRNCQNLHHLDLRGNADEYFAQNQNEVAAIIRPVVARMNERALEATDAIRRGLAAGGRGMPRPHERPRTRREDGSGRGVGGGGTGR